MVRIVVALLLTGISFCSVGQQGDVTDSSAEIVWGINEAPPFHITTGDYQGEGVCDAIVNGFQRLMPEVDQEVYELPALRVTRLMKRKENVCFACIIKGTDYNSDFLFSDITNYYKPHGIVTHKDAAKTITELYGNPVSLEQLVQDPRLRFAQPISRRYAKLQPLVDEFLMDGHNFRLVTGHNAQQNIFTMLQNERLDYTIDYHMVMNYFVKTHAEEEANNLVFLPIQENQGEVIASAPACPDTPWGRQAIKLINQGVPNILKDRQLNQQLDLWMGTDRPKSQ